jgi:hypothetical protein
VSKKERAVAVAKTIPLRIFRILVPLKAPLANRSAWSPSGTLGQAMTRDFLSLAPEIPPYPHFRTPEVRGFISTAWRDLLSDEDLDLNLKKAYAHLLPIALYCNLGTGSMDAKIASMGEKLLQRVRTWRRSSPSLEELLWATIGASYRFASPDKLGLSPWEKGKLLLGRILFSPRRSGWLDPLFIGISSEASHREDLRERFHLLKAFYGLSER